MILIDRLGAENFSTLQMKGHAFHRARAHLKVPGCSLVWKALLTSIEAFCLRMLHKKYFNVSNRWYAPDLLVSKMAIVRQTLR